MKILRCLALLLVLGAAAAYPQTTDLGMGAFSNGGQQPVTLVVDASLVDLKTDSPYLMFYAWMGATHENKEINVTPKNAVMVYNGQEYSMPSLEELRKNYNAMKDDFDIYKRMGKEGVIGSKMRLFRYPHEGDFFPILGLGAQPPMEEASLYNDVGFRTKLYFKNPGIKKGDTVTIRVSDKKDPTLMGEVQVTVK